MPEHLASRRPEAEARAAVQDYVLFKPVFIKFWIDDRGGTKKTLTPSLIRAIADEAHQHDVAVGVHNVTLANAKLMRAGVEGWLHMPVRGGDVVDDELIGIVKDRIARQDRPLMWMTPGEVAKVRREFELDGKNAAAADTPRH